MSFRLTKEKYKKFKNNYKGKYTTSKDKIYLPLEWKVLLEYGSNFQKIKWDNFRRKYILSIIKKFCDEGNYCYFELVGTKSIKSDIDINIASINFPSILKKIEHEHHKIFKSSLEDMFDINIYGSILHYLTKNCINFPSFEKDCFPNFKSSYRQRCWSFTRIVENIISLPEKERFFLINSFPVQYQKLFYDSLKLLIKDSDYLKSIYIYLNSLLKKDKPEILAEKYSKSKIYEKDSYRSVGAVLDIVYKIKLSKSLYYDSVYDNLGFIYDIVLKNNKINILKISKYMERIILAVNNIKLKEGGINLLDDLLDLCKKLNDYRKLLYKPIDLELKVDKFYENIGLRKVSTKIEFLSILTLFILNKLPKDKIIIF
jgi:hypothetical protein